MSNRYRVPSKAIGMLISALASMDQEGVASLKLFKFDRRTLSPSAPFFAKASIRSPAFVAD